MDRKKFRNTKREKIHAAMRIKRAMRDSWLCGAWNNIARQVHQLHAIKKDISGCY